MLGKKTAVIYFSHTGVTKSLVEKFPVEEDDKVIELIPAEPYPKSYFKTLARAKVEIEGGVEVKIENGKQDLKDYDRILIGFPIWFWTCPKIISDFVSENDFKDKTIYPFCTSGGIDITEAVDEIRRRADGADVKPGKRFRKYSEKAFAGWLEQE
jgi:flavodoxin